MGERGETSVLHVDDLVRVLVYVVGRRRGRLGKGASRAGVVGPARRRGAAIPWLQAGAPPQRRAAV